MDYTETFGTVVNFSFNQSQVRGWFVSLGGEADVLSIPIAPGREAKISATAQFTWFKVNETGTMFFNGVGFGAPAATTHEMEYRPRVLTVGAKGSIPF